MQVRRVGPESADVVLEVTRASFADRAPLDPPTDALAETVESLTDRLGHGGGLIAYVGDQPLGTVIIDAAEPGSVYLRRFGVTPAARGKGVARALVQAALDEVAEIEGVDRVVVQAREELPDTIAFWRRQGFAQVLADPPYVELARALPRRIVVPTSEDMQALGRRLASVLRAGDVLVLNGDLGAGKTTFTQGLGDGLGVRGAITSPTFVIARVHRSLTDGPALVHVDAYRLSGGAELDDLDLDTALDGVITVVEWGGGLAETLTEAPLEIRIERPDEATGDLEPRQVVLDPLGARWIGVPLT